MDQFPTPQNTEKAGKVSRTEQFIGYVIERINKDNGFAAKLKRADNPATEYCVFWPKVNTRSGFK